MKDEPDKDPKISAALAVLRILSRKEAIPLAIVGGLAAIYHGYERLTTDIDVVVARENLAVVVRVAPHHGIKVIWRDHEGWHKLHHSGVNIDVVPQGGKPRKDAPTNIPGPDQLGVHEGLEYASLAGWMETKLSSNRVQDMADVVQVMKKTPAAALARVRKHLDKVHQVYLRRFDEFLATAKEEKQQERERGGAR